MILISGDTGLRGWRPGFGPLSLRSDLTGHRGLGEKRKQRERAHACARPEREKKRESARARARSFLGLDAHVQEGRHMHTGSHTHRAGLGTVGARLCRADDTGGWTRWRPPAPRPAAHCSRTPSGADLCAVCRPNPQWSAGRPLRGRGRAHDAGICTPRPRGSGGGLKFEHLPQFGPQNQSAAKNGML